MFGDLEVVAAVSKDNGEVCPVADCLVCKGGVTRLTLRYDGTEPATIVVQDKDAVYFNAVVAPGAQFTVNGTKDDGKFEKNDLDVLVDGVLNAEIHVSCSQPIGPGLHFGDFTVVAAVSKDNGNVCPLCEADTGAPEITYSFAEPDTVRIHITDDAGLSSVDLVLRAFELDFGAVNLIGDEVFDGDPRFPVVVENTFVPGAAEAVITIHIDPDVNSSFVVTALDFCGQNRCVDDQNPPEFVDVVIGDNDSDGVIDLEGTVIDDVGVYFVQFLRLNNIVVDFLDFQPGSTAVDFRVERDNPSVSGSFGALAADQCNAFALDPVVDIVTMGRLVAEARAARLSAGLLVSPAAVPAEYALMDNYPNPFNPSTQIEFALPEATHVRLVVYDLLGRVVKTLVSGDMPAGRHRVTFDAGQVASGTYFYRLVTPKKTFVKTMMLLK